MPQIEQMPCLRIMRASWSLSICANSTAKNSSSVRERLSQFGHRAWCPPFEFYHSALRIARDVYGAPEPMTGLERRARRALLLAVESAMDSRITILAAQDSGGRNGHHLVDRQAWYTLACSSWELCCHCCADAVDLAGVFPSHHGACRFASVDRQLIAHLAELRSPRCLLLYAFTTALIIHLSHYSHLPSMRESCCGWRGEVGDRSAEEVVSSRRAQIDPLALVRVARLTRPESGTRTTLALSPATLPGQPGCHRQERETGCRPLREVKTSEALLER